MKSYVVHYYDHFGWGHEEKVIVVAAPNPIEAIQIAIDESRLNPRATFNVYGGDTDEPKGVIDTLMNKRCEP